MDYRTRVRMKAQEVAADLNQWAQRFGLMAPGMKMKVRICLEGTELTKEDWDRLRVRQRAPGSFDHLVLTTLHNNNNSPVPVRFIQEQFQRLYPERVVAFHPGDMAFLNNDFYFYNRGPNCCYQLRVTKPVDYDAPQSWDNNSIVIVKYGDDYEPTDEEYWDPYAFYDQEARARPPLPASEQSTPTQQMDAPKPPAKRRKKKWKRRHSRRY